MYECLVTVNEVIISIITTDACCDLALCMNGLVTVNEVIISIITTDACCDLALCMKVL